MYQRVSGDPEPLSDTTNFVEEMTLRYPRKVGMGRNVLPRVALREHLDNIAKRQERAAYERKRPLIDKGYMSTMRSVMSRLARR